KSLEELSQVPGIGKSTALKIQEILQDGGIKELKDLLQQTPPGIIPLLKIKGIGPKKIATIWKELGIDSLGELWYACKEDKISKLKGFGQKTQEELKNIVEFTIENEGMFRYADAMPLAEIISDTIKDNLKKDSISSITGELRRCCEIVDGVEVLIAIEKEVLI